MSLIDFKNFVEPIVDKRNLVTIVLIAGLFGMIRLSGGKAGSLPASRDGLHSTEQQSTRRSYATPMQEPVKVRNSNPKTIIEEVTANGLAQEPRSRAVKGNVGAPARDPFIDSARRPAVKKTVEQSNTANNSDKGLDEIEKQLGLR